MKKRQQKGRGKSNLLCFLSLGIVLCQFFFLYQTRDTNTTVSVDGNALDSLRMSSMSEFATTDSKKKTPVSVQSDSVTPSDDPFKPRVIIAIFSDDFWVYRDGSSSSDSRERHRKLIRLWNDKRLCSYNDYILSPSNYTDCNIVYTFLLGAHAKTAMDVPPMRLEDTPENPIELTRTPYNFPNVTGVRDLYRHNDFTLLNIRENMNAGKTPTFFYWAKKKADALDIPYVGKCDLDSIWRLSAALKFLYEEVPWTPRPTSTVLGCIKHKALWNETRHGNEQFWEENYYQGMHLYLGGQLYIMSTDLIDGFLQEARQKHDYFEGHEDHDVLSMIQVVNRDRLVRWISFPRNYRFWEHPVKGVGWWERIWRREQRKAKEGILPSNDTFSVADPLPSSTPSILLVLGATTSQARKEYRDQLVGQKNKRACSLHDCTPEASCNLCFAFVVGGNPNGPNETLGDYEQLVMETMNEDQEPDLVVLNITDNVDHGIGQTALHYLQSRFNGTLESSFDMVLFCQEDYMLSIDKWNIAQSEQTIFNRNLLVGDVRDRDQWPTEFGVREPEHYFYLAQENVHLYLGSDACFALSTGLVPGILHQARVSLEVPRTTQILATDRTKKRDVKIYNPRSYFMDNLGHDLTTLAYLIPRKALHWLPVPRDVNLWSQRRDNGRS